MLDDSMNDDYMLRVMTLLANLVCSAHRLKISGFVYWILNLKRKYLKPQKTMLFYSTGSRVDAKASEPESM